MLVHPEIRAALEGGAPVVALESTVIAHGLPWPENLALGQELESIVRAGGAVPATVAVLDGVMRVGLEEAELEVLARGSGVEKLSRRNLAAAVATGQTGATTVSATMLIARAAGIRVFATGGIGGVHRGDRSDVSADLPELARTPMIVVCAGAKAILDLPATLEWLETWGVPVVGYQTSEFPAFFSRSSGLPLETRADSPAEVAAIARAAWRNGLTSAVLVTVPCPESVAVPRERIDHAVTEALRDAERAGIRGRAVTPFLLKRVSELTGGESRAANLALLRNNAAIAAETAKSLS
ncbi:MAG TPA: pseudouridine-5'-phosphate glycosidase [Gemmatimonadales bacterium]|nr:pseudouridine-5'-phosphate glycosidase [Gemmatimonadales bacterium]